MSREEAISHIKVMIESLENAIKALESNEEWECIIPNVQEPSYNSIKTELKPSEDCISRQKVLDAIDAYKYLDGNDAIYRLKQWLNEQESVQPKMGHWFIDERPECNREVVCSNCEQPVFKYHKLDFDYRPNYCPNCGCKMREVER